GEKELRLVVKGSGVAIERKPGEDPAGGNAISLSILVTSPVLFQTPRSGWFNGFCLRHGSVAAGADRPPVRADKDMAEDDRSHPYIGLKRTKVQKVSQALKNERVISGCKIPAGKKCQLKFILTRNANCLVSLGSAKYYETFCTYVRFRP